MLWFKDEYSFLSDKNVESLFLLSWTRFGRNKYIGQLLEYIQGTPKVFMAVNMVCVLISMVMYRRILHTLSFVSHAGKRSKVWKLIMKLFLFVITHIFYYLSMMSTTGCLVLTAFCLQSINFSKFSLQISNLMKFGFHWNWIC